ncbi:hypothetical protein ABPG77_008047 [Micractinium sp. CCAP 211/92]
MTVLRVLAEVPAAIAAHRQQQQAAGLLVGLRDDSSTMVVGALHCEAEDLPTTKELAGALVPPPLAVLGCYGPAGASFLQLHTEEGGVIATYAAPANGDGSSDGVQFAIKQGGALSPCQPEPVTPSDCCAADGLLRQLAEGYVPVRCTAELVLSICGSSDDTLESAFKELEQQVCGDRTVFVAEVPSAAGSAAAAAPVLRLPGAAPFAELGASWARPALLRPLQRASGAGGAAAAPRLAWQPGQQDQQHSSLCLDVLCYVPTSMPASEAVASVVRPAVRRQLAAMQADVADALADRSDRQVADLPPQRALHLHPPGFVHHITVLYPLPQKSTEPEEEALLARRQALHRLLALPTDRPLLRVANAVDWSAGAAAGAAGAAGGLAAALAAGGVGGKPRLSDVHVGLPRSPVGGSVHLVQGSYDYYHYMQDKFDDSGWGCAYRSLQTLCSWFARQHYVARPPPGHREIQAALVQLGDKEAAFIGSKNWIGAIELGYVLDALLGVQHRVLSVQSGDDMPTLAREIAHHFDTQGTPIMIGGGVLAYTLLGIDFDERTGRCAFLILDPHYTGGEDLKKIHAGQWVAWKQPGDKAAAGGELFVSGSFYNLLCPQRPTTV